MVYLLLNGKKLKPFTCMEFMEEEEEEVPDEYDATLLGILSEPSPLGILSELTGDVE